jgi:hypothetical protein
MAEPSGAPGPRGEHVLVKTLSEDAPSAENCVAVKTPRAKHELNPPSIGKSDRRRVYRL